MVTVPCGNPARFMIGQRLSEELKRSVRHLAARARRKAPWLTNQRLMAFAVTLVAVSLALGGLNPAKDSAAEAVADASTEVFPQVIPERLVEHVPALPEQPLEDTVEPIDSGNWNAVSVRSGQTLGAIFNQQGYSAATLHQLVTLDENTKKLARIRPGDIFEFQNDEQGAFEKMRYALNDTQYLVVSKEGDALHSSLIDREITTEVAEADGVITSSMYAAAKEAGISDSVIMDLANIFGWDLDFVLDVREGDQFFIIYEKLFREGEFLKDGRILAATFVSRGQRYRAIGHESEAGFDYYDPDGRTMRREFLRAPLNFSYISSGFNPKRMHPVLKRVRPHNGIDYYAPRGTPVYAAGDGKVIRSAYSNSNGHHVFIQHSDGIVTKYLHFSNRAVKQGQKVRQGQTIGYVGSTGLATGPHLHYEFVVNGVHRNPSTVPLPEVIPLDGDTLETFQQQSAPMLTRLRRLESTSFYASAK